jgi:hypothetical protein
MIIKIICVGDFLHSIEAHVASRMGRCSQSLQRSTGRIRPGIVFLDEATRLQQDEIFGTQFSRNGAHDSG